MENEIWNKLYFLQGKLVTVKRKPKMKVKRTSSFNSVD